MQNKLKKVVSLGVSALMLVLVLTTVVPNQSTSTSITNPTHGISPLEDPPW